MLAFSLLRIDLTSFAGSIRATIVLPGSVSEGEAQQMAPRIKIDAQLVEHYLTELARFGAYGETGVWRTVYSPEWVAAQHQVMVWADEAGLNTWQDAVGNVWGRLAGSERGPSIVTGSHIDSQAPGGRFDGALGVVAGLVALRALREQFGPPRRTLELLSLCEEESSRFPSANFWGSRAITGAIEPDEVDTVIGYDRKSIGDAMLEIGLEPERIREAIRDDIDTFIELHIEQGPILEGAEIEVGIVNAITGLRHYLVTLTGRSDHAGARPMDTRLDPMAAAAEIIARVIQHAEALGRPAVTTVGRMLVEPNLPAAVPDRVTFTIDARHPDPDARAALYAHHEGVLREVSERRGIGLEWTITANHEPCLSDPALVTLLEDAARQQGIPALTLHSGAAHDTQRMAAIAKVAMIFVQSRDGRSHTPAEYTSTAHAVSGIRALAMALYRLAY